MSFHISNLGKFGESLRPYADALGFVPEYGDKPPYGYTDHQWAKHVKAAVAATKKAVGDLERWRKQNP